MPESNLPARLPQFQKALKLLLLKGARQRQFRCGDCGEPDPMYSAEASGWLNGELGNSK
jgi:hypothetical protein